MIRLLRAVFARIRQDRADTHRLIQRSDRLTARQRRLTVATGNYLRDYYMGAPPPEGK